MSEPVLVVGGAGFIGSHTAKLLHRKGYLPVVLDNLVRGHRWTAKWGPLVEADLEDVETIKHVLGQYRIRSVMHFAAYAYVGESWEDPAMYYNNNVAGTLSLLEAMKEAGVDQLIFSSSSTTYGEAKEIPIREDHPQDPISPYGRSKLMVERILRDYEAAYGMRHVALRYFNAAGADPDGELGETHDPETHLIPVVLDVALGKRPHVDIFGADWNTSDGTCIRDYIHVSDLGGAHVLALEHLRNGGRSRSFNLGNGEGYSVRQVIEEARRITGCPIPSREMPRRDGDPPVLVGDSERICRELGWAPEYPGLDAIIGTAWKWHRNPADRMLER
jgi:UDP-glucose-4-epimerase GalE